MSLLVKLMPCPYEYESRVHRELSVIKEAGYEIVVIARGQAEERKTVGDYTMQYYTATDWPVSSKLKRYWHRILLIFKWAAMARREKADCLNCYDISALLAGYLSTLFLKKKPLLVYDSHEFELGKNTAFPRNAFETKLIFSFEKFLIKRCALLIMVNDIIADRVAQLYKLDKKPLAVRNIPNFWHIDPSVCQKQRQEYLRLLNADDNAFILMYHGAIIQNRGVEQTITLVNDNPQLLLVVLGKGNKEYTESLKKSACDRVLFLDAVPLDILWQYVGAADLGVIILPGESDNHYYMLPNKFFENIQALTPVLTYNYPAMAEIISQYGIGTTCDPKNPDELICAIERFRTDKDFYNQCKNNLLIAKKELCWENEKTRLRNAFEALLN